MDISNPAFQHAMYAGNSWDLMLKFGNFTENLTKVVWESEKTEFLI